MQRPGSRAQRASPPRGPAAPTTGRAAARSFMIEEILTRASGPKGAAPPLPPPRASCSSSACRRYWRRGPSTATWVRCGAGGRGALAGLGGEASRGLCGRSSGHAGPGSFLLARSRQGSKGAGAGPRRNQARARGPGQPGRAFPLFFTATLWFPAPRSPARGPGARIPIAGAGPDCECQTSGQSDLRAEGAWAFATGSGSGRAAQAGKAGP